MRTVAGISLAVSALALSTGVATATTAQAAPSITITTIQYNPRGADHIGDNRQLNREFVVIKNRSRTTRSLTGWVLRDQQNHVYVFGATRLGAGKSITVHSGRGSNSSQHRYWGYRNYVWNNRGGDKATLKNAGGVTIDTCAYDATRRGVTDC